MGPVGSLNGESRMGLMQHLYSKGLLPFWPCTRWGPIWRLSQLNALDASYFDPIADLNSNGFIR